MGEGVLRLQERERALEVVGALQERVGLAAAGVAWPPVVTVGEGGRVAVGCHRPSSGCLWSLVGR